MKAVRNDKCVKNSMEVVLPALEVPE